jgi:hypothetical protein
LCELKETPIWSGAVRIGSPPGGIQLYSERMPGH